MSEINAVVSKSKSSVSNSVASTTILSGSSEQQSSLPTKTKRPTSRDYAAEIQRLELERLKLQSQPISLPVAMNGTSLALPPTRVETTGSLEVSQNGECFKKRRREKSIGL